MADWMCVNFTQQLRLWYTSVPQQVPHIKFVGKHIAMEQPSVKLNVSDDVMKFVSSTPKTMKLVLAHHTTVPRTVIDFPFSRFSTYTFIKGVGDED
jgi:hypothetical protein